MKRSLIERVVYGLAFVAPWVFTSIVLKACFQLKHDHHGVLANLLAASTIVSLLLTSFAITNLGKKIPKGRKIKITTAQGEFDAILLDKKESTTS